MGITHPAIIDYKELTVNYDPLGVLKQQQSGMGANPGYPMGNTGFSPFAPPAAPRVATTPGQAQPGEVRQIKQFDFKIQFVLKPIPVADRAAVVVETPADESADSATPADEAATPDDAAVDPSGSSSGE